MALRRVFSIFKRVVNKNITKWNELHEKKLNSLRNKHNNKRQQCTSVEIDPIQNYSHKILTGDEHSALVNGLAFVYRNSSFDEKTFISNVESLFVSLLGRCTDKFDWEKCDANEQTTYSLARQQLQYATRFRTTANTFKRRAIQEL